MPVCIAGARLDRERIKHYGGRVDCAPLPPEEHAALGWHGALELVFALRGARTVRAHARHHGPLRMQRAFHPEADGTCHVYVLHPPGGVVTGDSLHIHAHARPHAKVLLTAPGATKLYRKKGAQAELTQHFVVDEGARLEWLPQETIAFDGAHDVVRTRVELAADAHYAGWELLCLGRPAAGERFLRGEVRLETRIVRAGQLQWLERARYAADDHHTMLGAPGLGGAPVVGSFVIAAPQVTQATLEALQPLPHVSDGFLASTLVSGVIVVRYRGNSTLQAKRAFMDVFVAWRAFSGSPAVLPRIWST